MPNKNEMNNVETVEVETVEVTEDVTENVEEIVVEDSRIKKFFGNVKAGAKKHKGKLIGGALAAGALTLGVIKLVASHDEEDEVYDIDDYELLDEQNVDPVEETEE